MDGFEHADPGYAVLYQRAKDVLEADSRVREVKVSGSVGDGSADAWSDLDLQVLTHPEAHDAFLADWPKWLAEITPTVFARTPIAPFVINAVTDEGLTLDVSVFADRVPDWVQSTPVYTLGGLRFENVGEALEYAVAEQLRGMAGPFISLVNRDEHARHLAIGVPHLLGLLTVVLLAETGTAPPGKRWNASFTDEQLATIAALPPARATRDDMLAFGMAAGRLIITRAKPLFGRYGIEWPEALAQVAARRVREQLGIDTSEWLP